MKRLYLQQRYNATSTKDRYGYVVKKVKNSTSPAIGEVLSKAEVDEHCNSKDWAVDIS